MTLISTYKSASSLASSPFLFSPGNRVRQIMSTKSTKFGAIPSRWKKDGTRTLHKKILCFESQTLRLVITLIALLYILSRLHPLGGT